MLGAGQALAELDMPAAGQVFAEMELAGREEDSLGVWVLLVVVVPNTGDLGSLALGHRFGVLEQDPVKPDCHCDTAVQGIVVSCRCFASGVWRLHADDSGLARRRKRPAPAFGRTKVAEISS